MKMESRNENLELVKFYNKLFVNEAFKKSGYTLDTLLASETGIRWLIDENKSPLWLRESLQLVWYNGSDQLSLYNGYLTDLKLNKEFMPKLDKNGSAKHTIFAYANIDTRLQEPLKINEKNIGITRNNSRFFTYDRVYIQRIWYLNYDDDLTLENHFPINAVGIINTLNIEAKKLSCFVAYYQTEEGFENIFQFTQCCTCGEFWQYLPYHQTLTRCQNKARLQLIEQSNLSSNKDDRLVEVSSGLISYIHDLNILTYPSKKPHDSYSSSPFTCTKSINIEYVSYFIIKSLVLLKQQKRPRAQIMRIMQEYLLAPENQRDKTELYLIIAEDQISRL